MTRRDRKSRPVLRDWHLWSEVTRSVNPLRSAPSGPASREGTEIKGGGTKPKAKTRTAIGRLEGGAWSPVPKKPRIGRDGEPPERTIEPRIRRRLMRGQLPIDATIDLHGMRQAEAHKALTRFIVARHARGDRTVLVITGKGLKKTGFGAIEQKGVLRGMLPIWLNDPELAPLIAGCEVSAQAHGGEGAYYVRLRRGTK